MVLQMTFVLYFKSQYGSFCAWNRQTFNCYWHKSWHYMYCM